MSNKLCVVDVAETGAKFAPGHDRRMVEEVRRGARDIAELIPYPKLYVLAENGHGPADPVLAQSDPDHLAHVLARADWPAAGFDCRSITARWAEVDVRHFR